MGPAPVQMMKTKCLVDCPVSPSVILIVSHRQYKDGLGMTLCFDANPRSLEETEPSVFEYIKFISGVC